MFFNYRHLKEFGYEILGLKFYSLHTCLNYVKYFDEHHSLVCFSTIFNNRVMVYRLTPEQYEGFKKGEYALSHDGKGYGKTPTGYPVKNYGLTTIFCGGTLKNRKRLKEYLDEAEKLATKTKENINN